MTKPIATHIVLVVEDDAGVRESISEVLQDGGYSPLLASNGREALDRLHASPSKPCIILLDIMMPVMDGREFRLEQESDPELADIPVVVLSAHANVEETARTMHAASALRKPVELDALMSVIGRYCKPGQATV
jgi:CheY-like chemotaxis protein